MALTITTRVVTANDIDDVAPCIAEAVRQGTGVQDVVPWTRETLESYLADPNSRIAAAIANWPDSPIGPVVNRIVVVGHGVRVNANTVQIQHFAINPSVIEDTQGNTVFRRRLADKCLAALLQLARNAGLTNGTTPRLIVGSKIDQYVSTITPAVRSAEVNGFVTFSANLQQSINFLNTRSPS